MLSRNKIVLQIIRICSIVLIISILIKFLPLKNFLSDDNKTFIFIFLTLVKITFLILTLFWIRKFNNFKSKFYLNKSGLFLILSIILIFCVVNTGIPLTGVGESYDNFEHSFFLLYYLAVGLFEELFFRVLLFGFLYEYFNKKKEFKAVLITSLIFALFHLANLFDPQFVKLSVLNQVLYAFGIGLIFQSFLIKFNNIIFIGVIHGLLNYRSMFASEFEALNNSSENTFVIEQFLQTSLYLTLIIFIIAIPISYFASKDISKSIFLR